MALRGEYQQVTPALRSDIAGLQLAPGMQVTSLISGPHVKDSAHFQGRAVDISLPHTKAAWDWLIEQIKSGRWSRIGTTGEAVDGLQGFASQYGVQMFEDEGTGSHVHLEVPP